MSYTVPMALIPIFVDTNAFIHLRDLKDIPWKSVFSHAKQIDIFVIAPVIKELEGLKTGGNDRKRNRARAALAQIDEAMEDEEGAIVLRKAAPLVRLVVASSARVQWDAYPTLEQTTDHELVARTHSHGDEAVVFSHDRGPRIKAREIGVNVLKPLEDWHLPPEMSEKDRKIAQLERDMKARYPELAVHYPDLEFRDGEYVFFSPKLPPMSQEEIDRRVNIIAESFPRRELVAMDSMSHLAGLGLSRFQVNKYNSQYAEFLENVRAFFEDLHRIVADNSKILEVRYTVKNDSSVAAQGLRLEAVVDKSESRLFADFKDARMFNGIPSFPTAPTPPSPQGPLYMNYPSLHLMDRHMKDREPRDPTGFYWATYPEHGADRLALQCADFHARREWEDSIIVGPGDNNKERGKVTFRLSASNLPGPVSSEFRYRIDEAEVSWNDKLVVDLLRSWLARDEDDDE